MLKKLVTLSLLIGLCSLVNGQNPNLGAVGGQFLKLPVSATGTAMSGAIVSSVNDASSVFWNPAGLSQISKTSFVATTQSGKWMEFFNLNSFSLAIKTTPASVIAFSGILFTMDKMEITDEFNPNGTGQNFDAQDLALAFTYSRFLSQKFRVGISSKIIRQRIWNEVANGVAFDIGTQYDIPWKKMTLGMSMMNFGPDMKFDGPDLDIIYDGNDIFPNRIITGRKGTEEYPLPLTFTFGIGLNLVETSFMALRTELNAIHPNDNDERIHLGSELKLGQSLFLRGGYKWSNGERRISDDYTLGIGVRTPFSGSRLTIDVAYISNVQLPDIILYSIKVEL